MSTNEKKVFLAIADISGYTRFMLANQTALEHSQMVISALIEALLENFKTPIRISKLEGDAIFVFSTIEQDPGIWKRERELVRSQLLKSFDVFNRKLLDLLEISQCPCPACRNIERLRLKIVTHAGRALLHRIGQFDELSGADVILVHRLLKNSVKDEQYLLLTHTAHQELQLPEDHQLLQASERYDELGEIRTYVCLLPATEEFLREVKKRREAQELPS